MSRKRMWFEVKEPSAAQTLIYALTGIVRRRVDNLSPSQEKPKAKRKARARMNTKPEDRSQSDEKI